MPWGEPTKEEPIAGGGGGSETRLVMLAYASGYFIFVELVPTKEFWAEGEDILINYTVRNTGTVASEAEINVYDDMTDELVGYFKISSVPAGQQFRAAPASIYLVGKGYYSMPARDVTLRFELSP